MDENKEIEKLVAEKKRLEKKYPNYKAEFDTVPDYFEINKLKQPSQKISSKGEEKE